MHSSMILKFYSSWIWYHVEKVRTPQKSISVKQLACNILYNKKKKERKNPLLRALFSLSLEIDENDIWFFK